ncbi:transmembrane CLPTM1 family protein [Pelomyxa schiedti]|nr:transmembrane CLPTM1 family protein [Pelomyxa schiedti]
MDVAGRTTHSEGARARIRAWARQIVLPHYAAPPDTVSAQQQRPRPEPCRHIGAALLAASVLMTVRSAMVAWSASGVVPAGDKPWQCAIRPGEPLVLSVCLTDTLEIAGCGKGDFIWTERYITDEPRRGNRRALDTEVQIPPSVLSRNSTVYAHIFLSRQTTLQSMLHVAKPLVHYATKSNPFWCWHHGTECDNPVFYPYWIPELNIHLLSPVSPEFVCHEALGQMQYDLENAWFWPILLADNKHLSERNWIAIDDTSSTLPLRLRFRTVTGDFARNILLWQMYPEMMQILNDIPLWSFITCISVVSTCLGNIHLPDFSFWRTLNSVAGTSVTSLILDTACQSIIFLYLLDSDNRSTFNIIINGIALILALWKLARASKLFILKQSVAHSRTKEYDQQAMRFLLRWFSAPVILCFELTLMFATQRGIYSRVLSGAAAAAYLLSFLKIVPQLYINYKFKSVLPLPWGGLGKALEAISDDFYPFLLKMPVMHRISLFSNDVMFLVYLVQKWKYGVSNNRDDH